MAHILGTLGVAMADEVRAAAQPAQLISLLQPERESFEIETCVQAAARL